MQQFRFVGALLIGALVVSGCTSEHPRLPTQVLRADIAPAGCIDTTPAALLIAQLFPPGPSLGNMHAQLAHVTPRLVQGDTAGAQSVALQLADSSIQAYRQGTLEAPVGLGAATLPQAVGQLVDALFCAAALPPPGLSAAALGPAGSSGTSGVIGLLGGSLVTVEGLAGLQVPAGAVSADHLFLITRRDDLAARGACLNTPQPQYPLCYDFSVFPHTGFGIPVTVVVCQLEPPPASPVHERLVLAHPDPNTPGGILFTGRAADPFGLVCTNAALVPGGVGSLLERLRDLAAGLLLPQPLYASHGGMGGSTSSFSPFIAVDSAAELVVDSVWHSPATPTTADSITITAAVRNASAVPVGAFSVGFGGAATPSPVVSVPSVPPGASVPVSVRIAPRGAGTYQDTVTADVGNVVAQFNRAMTTRTSASYLVAQAIPF